MDFTFSELKPLNKCENAIIMFHGVGSNAKDLISIAPYMQQALDKTHFISLNAPHKYDMAPFGYQWFSLKNRELSVLQSGLAQAVPDVTKFLQEKAEELKLGFDKIFLMGFSQGSMLTTHIITSIDKKFAGAIGMSGSIIPNLNFRGNNKTPVCLIHGTADDVIGVETMYAGEKYLKSLGYNVEIHEIPYLSHSIDLKCLTIATNFIKNYHAS